MSDLDQTTIFNERCDLLQFQDLKLTHQSETNSEALGFVTFKVPFLEAITY